MIRMIQEICIARELIRKDWFREEAIRAHGGRFGPVFVVRVPRQHQHRDCARPGIGLQDFHRVPAIQPRHARVHENERRSIRPRLLDGFVSVLRFHHAEAFVLEVHGVHLAGVEIVVDHEDEGGALAPAPRGTGHAGKV
jgi:hypothetical protein